MLSQKQIKHNEVQKKKREEKRNKICIWCTAPFKDTSKRLSQKTCSLTCARELGVAKRKEKGSYIRTEEQNKKMVATISKMRLNGEWEISPEKRQVLSETLKKRWASGEMYNEGKETCLIKYGVEHPMQSPIVKENLKKAFIEKYGTEWATQNLSVKEKIKKTRLEKGLTYQFENKTMQEWSAALGISYSYFKQVVNEQGFEVARKLSASKTGIEETVNAELRSIYSGTILYDQNIFAKYRPDFILSDVNLIIECDGLAWHCDRIKEDKLYHKTKKDFYKMAGYKALFFRSDEIERKMPIVKSIILNSLKKNENRFFARKLQIKEISKTDASQFLEENHLMGNGKGISYALCKNDEIISLIQVKWKNKNAKVIEISRFCSIKNTSVVGGYSRLIKHIINKEKPKQIITYVDERYGDGNYLTQFGFIKQKTYVSFKWTNCSQTFHRMRFRGNSGYEKGLYKIWDCGQTLYIKEIR